MCKLYLLTYTIARAHEFERQADNFLSPGTSYGESQKLSFFSCIATTHSLILLKLATYYCSFETLDSSPSFLSWKVFDYFVNEK